MLLMDFWWWFIGQLVVGLQPEEVGHLRVGMQPYLDCLTGSFFFRKMGGFASVHEDGLVMGLSLLLEGPEMRGSCCFDDPRMGLP